MLPTIDGRLFALEGGNFQLAVRLLSACNARLHQPSKVETVEQADNGSYLLHTQVRSRFNSYVIFSVIRHHSICVYTLNSYIQLFMVHLSMTTCASMGKQSRKWMQCGFTKEAALEPQIKLDVLLSCLDF